MVLTDRVETNPQIMLGKLVIRGTRVTVELILRKLREGATEPELLDVLPPSRARTFERRRGTPQP